jgi:asparagine synthetase B (glutamine-hydrolysing)
MIADKDYCMSSFLTLRYIADENKTFKEGLKRPVYPLPSKKYNIRSANDIDRAIQEILYPILNNPLRVGIMLSGGMDSAILASYLPPGIKAYTLECQADGSKKETDEAAYFADRRKLEHHIVKITWDDYKKYTPLCMMTKCAPCHSIEPMIYKAAKQARSDGCTQLIFGESADVKFGGMDGLLSKDWKKDEFISRYTYIDPRKILKNPIVVTEPFEKYAQSDSYDAHGFVSNFFFKEGINSYSNACTAADIAFIAPYAHMQLDVPLDLQRIRNGESKYLIRELFAKRYPHSMPAVKLPMPRAVGIWLQDWKGPTREEFLPHCIDNLKGDQKWLVYVLEWFLNMLDGLEKV